jgi:hypothetical protein
VWYGLHVRDMNHINILRTTHYIRILITPSWSWALLEKLSIVHLHKNLPAIYGTRRFITVFTRALHWSLSWAKSIQSIPFHPISLRSILTYVLVNILNTKFHQSQFSCWGIEPCRCTERLGNGNTRLSMRSIYGFVRRKQQKGTTNDKIVWM